VCICLCVLDSYYKVIPELLELPEDLTLFVLSYFSLAWTLFGEVLASVTITQIMKRFGIQTALYVVTLVVIISAVFWLICSYWAITKTGPIKKVIELRNEHTKQHAHSAWRHLRHAIVFISKSKKHNVAAEAPGTDAPVVTTSSTSSASAPPVLPTTTVSTSKVPQSETTTSTSSSITNGKENGKESDEEEMKGTIGDDTNINNNYESTRENKAMATALTTPKNPNSKKTAKLSKAAVSSTTGEVNSSVSTSTSRSDINLESGSPSPSSSLPQPDDDSISAKVRKFKGAVYLVMLCNSFSHGVPHSMLGELEESHKEGSQIKGIKI
jgi:hypothetical protein